MLDPRTSRRSDGLVVDRLTLDDLKLEADLGVDSFAGPPCGGAIVTDGE
jgi:hypothetical protein